MEVYGNIKQRVIRAKSRLDQAQRKVIKLGGNSDCVIRKEEFLLEYLSINRAEEAFFFLSENPLIDGFNLVTKTTLSFIKLLK